MIALRPHSASESDQRFGLAGGQAIARLRLRELNRKKGVVTGRENELAIQRLRNLMARLQYTIEKWNEHDKSQDPHHP